MKISAPTILPLKDITIQIGNVRILGNGAWGKALASLISQSKQTNLKAFVLVMPTNAMRGVVNEIKDQVDNQTLIINCTKGIEIGTHKLPSEIVEEVLGKNINYFSLVGPSFAQEVADKNPTVVNIGYKNKEYLDEAILLFKTDYFDLVPTNCLHAIEIMGAFKNIYAIGCGVAEGLGYGTNTRIKLILLAYRELKKMLLALDYKYDQSAQIEFLGDLVLTCSSTESRNFTLGKLLARSPAEKAVKEVGGTTEGLFSIDSVKYFAQKTGIKLPLAEMIHDIVKNQKQSFDKFDSMLKLEL